MVDLFESRRVDQELVLELLLSSCRLLLCCCQAVRRRGRVRRDAEADRDGYAMARASVAELMV